MSECVVRMEMPRVCITENGYYGYCPMDRVWCIQRNAPPDITMREAYEAMTEKIPSWCPILCSLPEGHGRLVDADAMEEDLDFDVENDQRALDDMDIVGYERTRLQFDKDCKKKIMWYLSEAPTIVPSTAERSET